ncbi:MAG: transaldolase [Gammaproteobacteria bacterium]|nr:transaldolase [Gammaproteobacteria bacterium]
MSNLHAVAAQGQSIWLDSISQELLKPAGLPRMMKDDAITGVTSNPSIFAAAIMGSADYDRPLGDMAARGASTDEIYTALVTGDIQAACDVMRPVFDRTDGVDGYVSVEVSPDLAHDTAATVAEAREWVKRVDRPNLLIKVPATAEGIPAVRQLITEGTSVNVTLIFALERYREVMEAYLSGLEGLAAVGGDVSRVASVASFFVSRVDTEVDTRLEGIGTDDALALRGKAAIANARAAYGAFLEMFSGDRWEALTDKGARIQRPLWASTSTKNPAYRDVMYVEDLVAPDTVNTVPISTIDAYQDHGSSDPKVFTSADIAAAVATLDQLASVGIDYDDVVQVLEDEGVRKFADAYHQLLASIDEKRLALAG